MSSLPDDSPLRVPCRFCGAKVGKPCTPVGSEPPGLLGYHSDRYDDAGWVRTDPGDALPDW